jgi:glycolate oxidase
MATKSYNKISEAILKEIFLLVGKDNVLTDNESLNNYGHDETENLIYPPEVLVKPANVEQVSKIMKLAFKNIIPVTPIGAKTGLSGGSLSIHGGIGLSMERFNKILQIDEDNLQVHVQPGVITQVLQNEVAKKGLYYAPDPASRGSCFIGAELESQVVLNL